MNKSMEDIQLSELVLRKLEGVISNDEHKKLTNQLSSSDEMIRQYNELIILYSIFSEQTDTIFGSVAPDPTPYQLNNILLALASAQLEASPVQVEAEKPESESESMDEAQQVKVERGTHKGSLLLLIAPVAAILFFVLLAYFAPVNTDREVATLSDSIGAEWEDSTGPMEKGIRLRSGETPLLLKRGLVELLYDNEARVVIEAPAEFSMWSDYQIKVNYGRLYATVPSQAVGFTVSTPNATIVDKGTEFGVEADLWGRTELHVIKGKTVLFSGTEKDSRARHEVNQGQAKKVTDINQVQATSLKERVFVRRVECNSNFIWKGQEALSLADIVGGGNGLGTGRLNVGFDPLTGSFKKLIKGYEREGNGRYISVYNNSLIDGVFVPDENEHGFVVTSRGDRYASFRDTNNKAWTEICNGFGSDSVDPEFVKWFEKGVQLDGQVYGTYDKPVLVLHGNSGITFDLDAIRKMLPRLEIDMFEASCGVPDKIIGESIDDYWNVFDVHVLLDGQQCFYKEFLDTSTKKISISIPILKDKRFLTLAITDGGNGNHGDYAVFAEPKLILRSQ